MRHESGFVAAAPRHPGTRPRASRRTMRLAIYAALAASDCVAIGLAFLTTGLALAGDARAPSAIAGLAVMLPVYLGIAIQRKPYSARFFTNWRRTARDAITALVTATLIVMVATLYPEARTGLSRGVVALGGMSSGILLIAMRWAMHRAARRLLGAHPIATVVIDDGMSIAVPPGIDRIDASKIDLRPDPGDPHMLDRLSKAIGAAERVVLSCPADRRDAWATALKGANVQGEIAIPDLAAIGPARLARFGDETTIVVSLGPIDTMNRMLKRGFDLAIAVGALALLWPVMVLAAIAIRIDSPGPVLFRQLRMGRGNSLFAILKFRSMRTDLCDAAGDRSTARGDTRVTRVGRIIRATSIDELPQILNVLRGDMSVVGPRPHALGSLAGDKLFWEVDRRYWDRHAVKPGITGLAQIHGFRGSTAIPEDLENRLRSDIAYMSGWTIWRDIRILVMTLGVLFHRNAF